MVLPFLVVSVLLKKKKRRNIRVKQSRSLRNFWNYPISFDIAKILKNIITFFKYHSVQSQFCSLSHVLFPKEKVRCLDIFPLSIKRLDWVAMLITNPPPTSSSILSSFFFFFFFLQKKTPVTHDMWHVTCHMWWR